MPPTLAAPAVPASLLGLSLPVTSGRPPSPSPFPGTAKAGGDVHTFLTNLERSLSPASSSAVVAASAHTLALSPFSPRLEHPRLAELPPSIASGEPESEPFHLEQEPPVEQPEPEDEQDHPQQPTLPAQQQQQQRHQTPEQASSHQRPPRQSQQRHPSPAPSSALARPPSPGGMHQRQQPLYPRPWTVTGAPPDASPAPHAGRPPTPPNHRAQRGGSQSRSSTPLSMAGSVGSATSSGTPIRSRNQQRSATPPVRREEVVGRLYEEAVRRREERERELQQEREHAFLQEYTFRPVIRSGPPVGGAVLHEHQPLEVRLARDRQLEQRRREQMLREKEEEELAECTFRPKVNQTPAHDPPAQHGSALANGGSSTNECNGGMVWDRLYEEGVRRELHHQMLEEERLLSTSPTFQPKILGASTGANGMGASAKQQRPPIHERVTDIQRAKAERAHARRQQIHQRELTFRPEINKLSQQIVDLQLLHRGEGSSNPTPTPTPSDGRSAGGVRSHGGSAARSASAPPPSVRTGSEDTAAASFKPKLSKQSQRLVQAHALFRKNFWDRLDVYAQQTKSRKVVLAQQAREEEALTFRPTITPTSELLAQCCAGGAETPEDRVQRLACDDKLRQQAVHRTLQEQAMAHCTFRPEINKLSRALAQATTDLTRPPRPDADLVRRLEGEKWKECTFRPTITDKAAQSARTDWEAEERRRAHKLAEARRAKQYEEVKQCTFRPQTLTPSAALVANFNGIVTGPPDDQGAAVVPKGVAKHLERQQAARRRQEELEEKENRRPEVSPTKAALGITVPRPFRFTRAEESAQRRQRIQEAIRQQEEANCTFAPRTNAKAAVDLLQRCLLRDEPTEMEDLSVSQLTPSSFGE